MKKNILQKRSILVYMCLIATVSLYAVNYTSAGAGPADWHTSTSWIPNGVPTASDNVTISSGHTVTIAAIGKCLNLTVDGTISFFSAGNLSISGDYVVNGTETGTGNINFGGANTPTKTISGTGSFGANVKWVFVRNRNIASNVSASRTALTRINSSITVRNFGNIGIRQNLLYSGCSWINESGSTLSINIDANFFTGTQQNIGTFDCSAVGNTVIINAANIDIPNTVSGYYNLTLSFPTSGVKKIVSNTTILNNLTVGSNNTLNSNGFDLTIKGNFTKNGIFVASTGKNVIFSGTSAQSLSSSGTTAFTGLTIDNPAGVNLTSGSYSLSEVLTLNNGTFNTGGRTFTMLSTASKTARIAPIAGSGTISGNFTVQRFITARDTTWSILSSPVQSTTMQDWDNELFIYYSTDYYQATTASYDEPSASYLPVSSASKTISPMEGFEVYLLADFSFNGIGNTTLNSVGVPNFGDQSMGLDYTAGTGYEGQNLVGNPFASSIDWSTVYSASSNIDNYADIYDYTTGNYASINLGDEIGSGQGFWVYALGAGATLNIPESAKTTSSNSSLRKAETPVFNLSIASADGSHSFAHRLELLGDMSYSNQKDANDRPYRMSPNKKAPKITSLIDGKEFIRNAFNSDAAVVNLPLLVSVGLDGKYSISAQNMEALAGGYTCIVLKDNKLNQSINLNEAGSYTFIATTKDAKDRFELELSKNGNCRSVIALSNVNIEDQVLVLPTTNGNSIAFNFTETLNTTVYVTNMLGQSIVEPFNVQANTQTIELGIPEDFSGMYILTISNEKGMVSKKFVKK